MIARVPDPITGTWRSAALRHPLLPCAGSWPGIIAAFSAVVGEHYGRVLRVAARLLGNPADAEDVAQEAFLKLWNDAAGIRDDSSLPAWLMRVATNLAFDRLRRKTPIAAAAEVPDILDEKATADRDQLRADIGRTSR